MLAKKKQFAFHNSCRSHPCIYFSRSAQNIYLDTEERRIYIPSLNLETDLTSQPVFTWQPVLSNSSLTCSYTKGHMLHAPSLFLVFTEEKLRHLVHVGPWTTLDREPLRATKQLNAMHNSIVWISNIILVVTLINLFNSPCGFRN